ncbi:hypothetical protein Heshes_16750 [Alicyclobacillus hesperidum]|uniref:Transglutaminase-like domain-containing protein n=1 Tax=Alicyclobacillus hesperidum TaxID=89784 RepID=A0AA37U2H0_9BACL|nr:transglutaminase-like domain-containing protein [Alicyclobacillus hesperidum]GLV13991.1 hypothetical protein Heshes_16750 [Alicyclobacillus hesperidum]
MHDWLTIVLVACVITSALLGFARGFTRELRTTIAQVMNIAVACLSGWLAWHLSAYIRHWMTHPESMVHLPKWITHLATAWQQAPRVGNLICFAVLYLILSNLLMTLVRPLWGITFSISQRKPGIFGRMGGSGVGAIAGALRAAALGACIFLANQYLSLPALARAANASTPYIMLERDVYKPWLQPFATRELPVLAQGALHPIAENISLFAIPTPGSSSETGILIVPKPVATKALQITKGDSTPEQKAKALYEWEIHHISYDWAKYDDYVYHGKWDAQSPLQTLKTGKGVCADFALLYADMAHACGLTVRIDEGLGGTAGDEGSHAWNEVYLPAEHRWILIDTTWGSEQDDWFNVPPAQFDQTHQTETSITFYASP